MNKVLAFNSQIQEKNIISQIYKINRFLNGMILESDEYKNKRKKREMQESSNDLCVKILFVGDSGVGKTKIIRRACCDQFDDSFIMTLGKLIIKHSSFQIFFFERIPLFKALISASIPLRLKGRK